MLILAMSVGFGVTGVMLYTFTTEYLKQYAVLKALGATTRLLLAMIFVQAGVCALLGTGLGLGRCASRGPTRGSGGRLPVPDHVVHARDPRRDGSPHQPRRGSDELRPVFKLEPALVFAGR